MGKLIGGRAELVSRIYRGMDLEMAIYDKAMKNSLYHRATDGVGRTKLSGRDKKFKAAENKFRTSMCNYLDQLSAIEINDFRYMKFSPYYDQFMLSHEVAMAILIKQVAKIEQLGFQERPLFGNPLVELSCGTGTVIKILSSALTESRFKDMKIFANDKSDHMKEIAKAKLEGLSADIFFTDSDISSFDIGQSFQTAMLSQTVHLICEEAVIRQERKANYRKNSNDRHLNSKAEAIEKIYNQLSSDGTFIVIDEEPALLSDGGGPMGPSFAYLFNDSLRAITWERFRYSIMNQLENTRFVTQLMVPIDSIHTMHIIIYRKDQDKLVTKELLPEDKQEKRDEASSKLIEMFRAIENLFLDGMKPQNGQASWLRFLKKREEATFISRKGELPNHETNCIIIDRCIHNMSNQERSKFIKEAVDKIKVGGSLMLIDEWSVPTSASNPIRKSVLRDAYFTRFSNHLDYVGQIRLPILSPYASGMYGFEYRKVL